MTTTQTTCYTCQINQRAALGERVTMGERNHATMWGCTCDEKAAAEATEFMGRVTR